MTEETAYWIWLQKCLGTDNKRLIPALRIFHNAENIFRADEAALNDAGIFSPGELEKLKYKDYEYSTRIMERCRELGYNATGLGESGYPARLAAVPTPPIVIYTLGDMPDESLLHMGVVGTRNPDENGRKLSYNMAYDLARNNTVIVSGGAVGIDLYAHKGCIDAGGNTVCVIACGIDKLQSGVSDYLIDNVIRQGAILSEYPPGYPPTKYTFPARDRIISGNSDGTLVVQAGMGSGALIAVKYAIGQNRKVFSVPGSCSHIFSTGSNYLIRSGFTPVLSYMDILSYYNGRVIPAIGSASVNPRTDIGFLDAIAVKAEGYIVPRYSERKLSLPAGYAFFCDWSDDSGNVPPEQLKIPLPENDIPLEPVNDAPEKAEETAEADEELQEKPAAEQDESFVHMELYTEKKQSMTSSEISEKELLRSLRERALRGEPEPDNSYISKMSEKTSASQEYIRLQEIDNLTKHLRTGEGIHSLSYNRVKELFGMVHYEEEYIPADQRITVPDLNDFDEIPVHDEERSEEKAAGMVKNEMIIGFDENIQKNDIVDMQKDEEKTVEEKNSRKISSEQLTENACSVYDTISETPIHVDTIKTRTGIGISGVLSALTELQINGLVRKLPGSRYVRK